ncbi:MAG: AMP-binding protein [Bacteroidota bacterium]
MWPSRDLRNKLESWCQTSRFRHFTPDLTRFNCLATLVLAFLHKASGQQKVAVGTPAHNRPNARLRNTPGQFIEVLPLMAELEPEETFASLHDKVRANYNGFLKNAKAGTATPDLLRPVRFVLNYINAKFPVFEEKPVEVKWIHPRCHDSAHQLRLQVYDYQADGQLEFDLDINEAAFTEELCDQIPAQLLHVFEQMLDEPDMLIAEAGLLPDEQAQNQLLLGTGEEVDFHTQDFLALFSRQVDQQPEHRAISFGEHSMSYLELEKASNQLAHFLLSRGLQVGDTVAIHHKRHPRLLIAILAVLKSGGTYVPLAADLPAERLQLILHKSRARILLTETGLYDKLGELEQACVLLDKDASMIDQHAESSPEVSVDSAVSAYLLYTSGSTGQPKGVMISKASLANYIQWAGKTYMQGRSAVFPLFTAIGFDLTVTSIFVPLAFGGQIRVYEEKLREGPDLAILEVLAEDRVDIIKLTPSHLSLIQHKQPDTLNLSSSGVHPISALEGLASKETSSEENTDPDFDAQDQVQEVERFGDAFHQRKSKRASCLIVGGENFTTDLAKRALAYFGPDTRIYNEYGPTEATVGCIVHQFSAERDQQSSVPIGRPIANMQALILSESGQMQPQGVAGELYLAGKGLATGYWQDAEQTQNRFLPHALIKDRLMYKTGDLAIWNKDGTMEFLGRVDRQVKFRGFRLELNEVEALVAQHPRVSEVAVELLKTEDIADEEVVNCVKCGLPSNYPGADFNEDDLCRLCRNYEHYEQATRDYFRTMGDLSELFAKAREEGRIGEYDCISLLSGGKDSSYALGQLVEMGLKPLAFTLDNGYISEEALDNVRRITSDLGVDVVFGRTDAMDAIFVDSLERHCNVCNGCFKTIYTLSVQIALEKKIPYIVTGLSRGQFFETRLTEELFTGAGFGDKSIDDVILEARKIYHRADDAVRDLLDVSMFEDDSVFEQVQFVDFYRYCDATLAEMYEYLDNVLPWIRPSDTGRSTNCVINQLGIYVHTKQKGYSNYAFPYSWDVRVGHKERDAALDEINEEIIVPEVKRMMREIGYEEPPQANQEQLVLYYSADEGVSSEELRKFLAAKLPPQALPTKYYRLESMPITANGKIDRKALRAQMVTVENEPIIIDEPATDMEEFLAELWKESLNTEKIGTNQRFIDLGGHSLIAIRLAGRINDALDIQLPLTVVFEHPTIAEMAKFLESYLEKLLQESD